MCACANGSVFVASWSGTCFFFFFFSEIIGPAAAGPAGPAPAPLGAQESNTGEQRIRYPSCSGMPDASEYEPYRRHAVAVCQHVESRIETGWLWRQGVSFLHNTAQANLQGECHTRHVKVCPCAFHEKPLQLTEKSPTLFKVWTQRHSRGEKLTCKFFGKE